MARASRPDGIVKKLPKGMQVFTVVSHTIKDSTGAYCTEGQQAALNKDDATKYHKLNLIQVGLPSFDEPEPEVPAEPANTPEEDADASEPTSNESAETPVATRRDRRQVGA